MLYYNSSTKCTSKLFRTRILITAIIEKFSSPIYVAIIMYSIKKIYFLLSIHHFSIILDPQIFESRDLYSPLAEFTFPENAFYSVLYPITGQKPSNF